MRNRVISFCLRAFQFLAYAEGALLPSILLIALFHWVTGKADLAIAIVGATHGSVFTLYLTFVPIVARLLRWPMKTISVAISVAFVPFATWGFERRIRGEIAQKCLISDIKAKRI